MKEEDRLKGILKRKSRKRNERRQREEEER
jgi:hypothetical protein